MSTASATNQKREVFAIPSLDGIRALSFFVVFLAHVGVPSIPGGFGVTVFFFLSGYLITTLLRREAEATGGINFKSFYLRRVLRILPPFYLILTFAFLCTRVGLIPSQLSWSGLASQALHYSNYWVIRNGWDGLIGGTGVYWSLAVEEHFYLLFPALYAALLKARASARMQHAVLLLLCALVLIWRCYLVFHGGIVGDRTYIGSDTRFDAMLFGCALAVWGNPALDFPKQQAVTWPELLAAAAGTALLLVSFIVRDPLFRESARYTLQGIGLYPLFFVLIRHPQLSVARLLNLRPVRFVGTLSYSLYLLHQVVIHCVASITIEPVAVAVLSLIISLLLAVAVWRFVEKPCASLRSRLAGSLPSATTRTVRA